MSYDASKPFRYSEPDLTSIVDINQLVLDELSCVDSPPSVALRALDKVYETSVLLSVLVEVEEFFLPVNSINGVSKLVEATQRYQYARDSYFIFSNQCSILYDDLDFANCEHPAFNGIMPDQKHVELIVFTQFHVENTSKGFLELVTENKPSMSSLVNDLVVASTHEELPVFLAHMDALVLKIKSFFDFIRDYERALFVFLVDLSDTSQTRLVRFLHAVNCLRELFYMHFSRLKTGIFDYLSRKNAKLPEVEAAKQRFIGYEEKPLEWDLIYSKPVLIRQQPGNKNVCQFCIKCGKFCAPC